MQNTSHSNKPFHGVDLGALSTFQSEHGQVFSLYLDLRSEKDLLRRFDRLLAEVEEQHHIADGSQENQRQWKQDADRIRQWLKNEPPSSAALPFKAQGLALISSLADGLWHPFLLPVPVTDRLSVKGQPFLQPLQLLQAEYPCTLLVLFDNIEVRLMQVFLGKAEPLESFHDGNPEKLARSTVQGIQAVMEEAGCTHLVLGGSGEALSALPALLPEAIRGDMDMAQNLSFRATPQEIIARMQEIEAARERETEARRVEDLLATRENDDISVMGMEQSLMAVRSGKARLLLVEEDYHRTGGECPNCGFLGEGDQGVCLLCGMSLRPEPDIVEVAMLRVLEKGGKVDVLRSPESRAALKDYGHIGALLREAQHPPHEEETANQNKITNDGKIHPDALHDEHVEESFPASDPPGNW